MTPTEPKHKPFVPETMQMQEFTIRALLLGLVLCVVLGAANAYLGLRAGLTIAATYPAAVISMAVLKAMRGTILEENISRTAGSIGESVAAGAIFTLPAFLIAGAWRDFSPGTAYWKSTVLMVIGSVLGVLFVSVVRRGMVEDPELPFPESVAAAEIHKAGQRSASAAKFLFWNMGVGSVIYLLGVFKLFEPDVNFPFAVGNLGRSIVRLGGNANAPAVNAGGFSVFAAPSVAPSFLGVGYIIGPRLAALNFAGGLLAWGLMIPLLIFVLGPQLSATLPPGTTAEGWGGTAAAVWRFIVRPIAVGGMLVGAAYTLFRMRNSLTAGLGRAFDDLKTPAAGAPKLGRTEQYMSFRVVFAMIAVVTVAMAALYIYLSGQVLGGVVAALVMLVVGFFFATVSGSLVGTIGSSNNPISGLTLCTVIIAALLMVSLGVSGGSGVAVVLGVAAVVCVSSAVAGELLQDFKVGYILGGTPRTIQWTELLAVLVASLVMYFPVYILHQGSLQAGRGGLGGADLPAPQAGLMALLSQGIVNGEMNWPLVLVGVAFGLFLILVQVKSPMLVSVGMYLPLGTTFAIFVGGLIRWLTDTVAKRRGYNEAQLARIENAGVLTASGLIAGEGLMGLLVATFRFFDWPLPEIFAHPGYAIGVLMILIMTFLLIRLPLSSAGDPREPAPPAAMM